MVFHHLRVALLLGAPSGWPELLRIRLWREGDALYKRTFRCIALGLPTGKLCWVGLLARMTGIPTGNGGPETTVREWFELASKRSPRI